MFPKAEMSLNISPDECHAVGAAVQVQLLDITRRTTLISLNFASVDCLDHQEIFRPSIQNYPL